MAVTGVTLQKTLVSPTQIMAVRDNTKHCDTHKNCKYKTIWVSADRWGAPLFFTSLLLKRIWSYWQWLQRGLWPLQKDLIAAHILMGSTIGIETRSSSPPVLPGPAALHRLIGSLFAWDLLTLDEIFWHFMGKKRWYLTLKKWAYSSWLFPSHADVKRPVLLPGKNRRQRSRKQQNWTGYSRMS